MELLIDINQFFPQDLVQIEDSVSVAWLVPNECSEKLLGWNSLWGKTDTEFKAFKH